jgi:hypothetical protein
MSLRTDIVTMRRAGRTWQWIADTLGIGVTRAWYLAHPGANAEHQRGKRRRAAARISDQQWEQIERAARSARRRKRS